MTTELPNLEIVDCSDNPYDLRPGVAAVIEKIREARKRNRKVVINVGGWPANPTHVLFNVALNDAIKNDMRRRSFSFMRRRLLSGKRAITLEIPGNFIDIVAKKSYEHLGYRFNQAALDYIKENNPALYNSFNRMARRTTLEYNSPLARFAMNDILSREDFYPTFSIDTPITNIPIAGRYLITDRYLIDTSDPKVKSLIDKYPVIEGERKDTSPLYENMLNPDSQYGVRLRNIFMLQEIKNILKASDIVCGAFGLAAVGGQSAHFPYSGSLDGLASSILGNDVAVINVFQIREGRAYTPQNYLETKAQKAMAGNTLFISGLHDDNFYDFHDTWAEELLVRRIFESSKLDIPNIPHGIQDVGKKRKTMSEALFSDLVKHGVLTPPPPRL